MPPHRQCRPAPAWSPARDRRRYHAEATQLRSCGAYRSQAPSESSGSLRSLPKQVIQRTKRRKRQDQLILMASFDLAQAGSRAVKQAAVRDVQPEARARLLFVEAGFANDLAPLLAFAFDELAE